MTRPKNASHPLDIPLKPEFANAFWKIMVKTRGLRGALAGLHGLTRKHPEMILQTVQMAEAMDASEPDDTELKALKSADAFWRQLVETVGESQAKQIMQCVMGEKKTGRSGDPLLMLIYT